MLKTKRQFFCSLPFFQTVTRTNGVTNACCNMSSLNTERISLYEFWQSPQLEQLKKDLLEDKENPHCSACHESEKIQGVSLRTMALDCIKFEAEDSNWKIVQNHGWHPLTFPKRIEIHTSNLCNLKCLTCRPEDSSAFLSENNILNISEHRQVDYRLETKIFDEVLKAAEQGMVDELDLRGGESMIVPEIERFLLDLDQKICDTIGSIRIQTNCTSLSDNWKKIFNKFQKVFVMFSIDGIGNHNEYVRFPSKWSDIENNIAWIMQQHHVQYNVGCLVSNLNVMRLPQILDWCIERRIHCSLPALSHPDIYVFNNLPEKLLRIAQDNLSPYLQRHDYYNWQDIKGLASVQTVSHPKLWQRFCTMINKRDAHRKNSIFDVLPELKDYWHGI